MYLETNLCYVEEEKNSLCNYPYYSYDCQKCVENASLVDGICQCNEGYYGLGYTYCGKEDGNIFFFIFLFKFYLFIFIFIFLILI